MRLKIYNNRGRIRWQFEVVTKKEAQQLFELHAKETDRGYLYIESSMRVPVIRPQYKPLIDQIKRAKSGRILSKREVANG